MANPPIFDLTGATKDALSTWRSFMGIPEQGNGYAPRGLRDFGRQPADDAWVYKCMSIRAKGAAGVPLRVQVLDGTEWVDNAATNDAAAADLQLLLDDVNPGWEGAGLQAYTEAGGAIHGGSYWRKVRGRLGGPPQELYWLSGADVQPVMKAGDPFPRAYEHRPPGITQGDVIAAKDIIAHRDTVNLANPYELLSPLSAARNHIAVNKAAAEWNANILNNWGIPPGAWVADKEVDFGPTERSLIRRALAAVRGPKNAGKVPVLPGGLKWVPLAMSQQDMDWINSGKVSRMVVCAVLEVPLVVAGDDEKAGVYASVRDAERFMWRASLIPGLDARASRVNSWLVPDFDKTRRRLRVAYDYSGIEALRAAPAEDMQQILSFVKAGMPLNRALARYNLGRVEGGDEARFPDLNGGDYGSGVEGEAARPEEYSTEKSLPDKLYRDASVKAFIASGDPSVLRALVPERLIPALAEGIRQRESAEQIIARFNEVTP